MSDQHKDEALVIKIAAYPKNSAQREKDLEKLRLMGNYYNNLKVLETGEGEFIPVRRYSVYY